ncbi:unnamed protein product, partial [Heterosigma akashiwo]
VGKTERDEEGSLSPYLRPLASASSREALYPPPTVHEELERNDSFYSLRLEEEFDHTLQEGNGR